MRAQIIFLLLLCSLCLQAQEKSRYVFTHFERKDGLASDRVFAIIQDKDGFMWIGNDNGLQRYDGHRFVTIRHNPSNKKSLPDDLVTLLHSDKKGRLWVAAGKKIGILNRTTFEFTETPVKIEKGLLNNGFNKFYEDRAGNMMTFIGKKLVTYNEERREFSADYNTFKVPEGWSCEDITEDPKTGNYWICSKTGLLLYDVKKKTFIHRENNPDSNRIIKAFANVASVSRIFIDKHGDFWLCSWTPFRGWPELFRYDVKADTLHSYKQETPKLAGLYHEIWGMTNTADGNFWVYGYGIFVQYDAATKQFRQVMNEKMLEHTIKFDYILNVYRDKDENFWVCCNNGLYLFNPSAQLFNSIANRRVNDSLEYSNPVTSIVQTKNKNIWVGTWRAGLFSYDENLRPIKNPLIEQDTSFKKLAVWGMIRRANDEIWIGTKSGTVVVYKQGEKPGTFTHSTLGNGVVRQFVEDKKGNVWIGSETGELVKCANGNWRDSANSFKQMKKLPGRVLKLFEDNIGFIWVGTDMFGAYKLDPVTGKELEHYDEKSGEGRQLMNPIVTDFVHYNDTLMFLASNSLNVLNLRTKQITYISTADGLPANQISVIHKDKAGYIWIGLSNGLCRYNYERNVFSNFDVRNGVLNNNFEGSATTFLADGRLAMGTFHDFLVFNPAEVLRQNNSTQVKITDVILFGRSLPMDSLANLGKLRLDNSQNSITINYSVLSYLDQNKVTYFHKLEGLDKDWVRSENQQAVYNYIPSGSYTFRVRAVNGNGVASEADTVMNIRVLPPFWNTWWFAALVLIALGAIAFAYYQIKKKQKQRLEDIRERIATDLHDDMGSTLSSIRIFSDVVKTQVGEGRPQAISMLDKISVNASQLSENMQDIIWTIKRDHDRLEDLVARMREFGLKLCEAKNISFNVRVSDSFRTSKLNLEERRNLYLVFKEALNNAVKYSGCTAVNLFITQQGKRLKMVIEDNGKGFSESTVKKGNGLSNISKRAQEVNGFARIESAEGKGTRIDVLIKLN